MEMKQAAVLERRSGADRREPVATLERRRGSERRRLDAWQPGPLYLPGDAPPSHRKATHPSHRNTGVLKRWVAHACHALAGIAQRLGHWLAEYRQRRTTIQALAQLDRRLLRDIGVSPSEIDVIYRTSGRYTPLYELPGINDWFDTRRPSL